MKDVSSNKGRTIIFVSHNMQAVSSLCSQALWLQKGKIVASGKAGTVVNNYMGALQKNYGNRNGKKKMLREMNL